MLVRIDTTLNKNDFRRIIVHELMHIFCAKLEIDTAHFIDIYGSGTTPDTDPEDKTYDGLIVAGYDVWTEFVAHYYAIKLIDKGIREFAEIAEFVIRLFHEVSVCDLDGSKGAFSMICAHWLNCSDFEESLAALSEPGTFIPVDDPHGEETQKALFDCIEYLYKQMKRDKPWEIDEEFIYGLGFKFSVFREN